MDFFKKNKVKIAVGASLGAAALISLTRLYLSDSIAWHGYLLLGSIGALAGYNAVTNNSGEFIRLPFMEPHTVSQGLLRM